MTATDCVGRTVLPFRLALQSRDFQRPGVFGRWNDPYLTMSAEYESVIAGAFVDFLRLRLRLQRTQARELVHPRPHRPRPRAEVEYEKHTSPSIWVRFALTFDLLAKTSD